MEVVAVLDRLHGLIDELVAADVAGLDADGLQVLTEGLQREQSRLAVAAAGSLAVWEPRGGWRATRARTAGLALGNRVARCHHEMAAEIGRAGKLARMARVRAAVLDGRLSMDHVDLICKYATDARWELFVRDEELLVDTLAGLGLFADGRKVVRYWADHVDDELEERSRPPVSDVSMSRSRDTGEVTVRGSLAPIDGEVFAAELERLCREVRLEDAAAGVERTAGQRRAAALVRMAARSASSTGVSPRPLFQVIVGDRTMARLCELASGVVVRPHDLLPYLDTGLVESFLFDEQHRLVGVSRQRTFRGRLRRAIQARDRRCQHDSGCPVPATDLVSDVDHIRPWAAGGVTSDVNGEVECTAHNRLPHLHGPAKQPKYPAGPYTSDDGGLLQIRQRLRWQIYNDPDDPLITELPRAL